MIKEVKFTPIFKEGEVVYIRTDIHQMPYVVIGYLLNNKAVYYQISSAGNEPMYITKYELTTEKDQQLVNEYNID